jgi:hypothetical protein
MTRTCLTLAPLIAALTVPSLLTPPASLRAAQAPAATTATQEAERTRLRVERLASEAFGGREAGSDGERQAAAFIAGELARLGARPLPGRRDMFATFDFPAGSRDGNTSIAVAPEAGGAAGHRFTGQQVDALSFSESVKNVLAPAVFAGYGIVVPESQNFGYDSYAGLDVKDKVVVVLRYFPEDADPRTKGILARYSDLRFKAQAARQRGARGIVVVTGPSSPNAGRTVPLGSDTAAAGSAIPAVSVTGDVANALFAGARSLEEAQKELDSGNPHVAGFPLPVTVSLTTDVITEKRTARNVVAYLPATTSTSGIAKPWVVVGAHYDHLGRGAHGNSLASAAEVGRAHLGADDNASGTAAVLAIADMLAKQPRQRHVVFALWSAEEMGLLGSGRFVAQPPMPVAEIAAYLNYDMVGRMQDNKLTIQATGTSPSWPSLLERANVAAGFDVVLQEDPYQPTDVASFNQAGVPSLSFTTGAHPDYHKPSDTADKIAYEDLDRVSEFGAAIVQRLMAQEQPPAFARVEQSSQTAGRTGLRVFTGTIPDYASTVKGLLLSGVVGGGPAEKAGLAKGDVLIEIAGQSIANIYDYTYALELLKVDTPVKVIYMRGNERRETMLTPGVRR